MNRKERNAPPRGTRANHNYHYYYTKLVKSMQAKGVHPTTTIRLTLHPLQKIRRAL